MSGHTPWQMLKCPCGHIYRQDTRHTFENHAERMEAKR